MKKHSGMAMAAALMALLQGCGGGGDGPGDQKTQGFWQGTADNGRSAWGFVQPSGRFIMIRSGDSGAHTLESMEYGTFSSTKGVTAYSDDSMTVEQYNVPFSVAGTGHGSAEFRTRQSWAGKMDGSAFVYYQMNYVNDGFQSSSLATLARAYASWPIAARPSGPSTMTVSTSGALSGTYFTGCTYTGQATATTQANVYDITLTLAGTSCNGLQGTITGLLVHDAANMRVFAVAGTGRSSGSAGTRAFMFVGL